MTKMEIDGLIEDCEATLSQVDELSARIDQLQELLEKRLQRVADAIEDTSELRDFPRSLVSLADEVPNADDIIYDEQRDEIRRALKSIRSKLKKAGVI